MTMGIYDTREKKGIVHRRINVLEATSPDYHVFDLGPHNLHEGMYFWIAPPKRPGEVTAVYIDRVFLIHEN